MHGVINFVNLPWTPVKPRDTQLYVVIGLIYTLDAHSFFFFFLRSKLVAVLTLLISQPHMVSTIFRHFWHRKKHLVSTTFTLPYYTPALKNAESHENMRSNPRTYWLIKTQIYTTINKNPLPAKTNANPRSGNSRPNPSKHTPPSTTKTW